MLTLARWRAHPLEFSMNLVLILIVCALVAGYFALRRYLRGPDMSRYDSPLPAPATTQPSAAHHEIVAWLGEKFAHVNTLSGRTRLMAIRELTDAISDDVDRTDLTITPTNAGGVPAEWVLAPGADADRRLLYIHGGAWMMGSLRSHRRITAKLARETGCAVLAIDYRLMPEHSRLACIEDCQTAYRWILANGPNGAAPIRHLVVSGDSAGGNLTLVTVAWARDAGMRAADAVVALAPATDATMSTPSLTANIPTDALLGPMFGKLTKVPRVLLLLAFRLKAGVRACDPCVSPLHGDLSKLPPTLIHVSDAEMLLDDARRYERKASEAGSPVTVARWPHMLHVWHIHEPTLPEAKEAFAHIAQFVEQHAPRAAVASSV
jgi:epsilon-lactone hydrolase